MPRVRHRSKVRDYAFDHMHSITAHRVSSCSVISVGRDEADQCPHNRESKKDTWKPFLHPSRWLPENANSNKRRQRQANGHGDEPECCKRPLSVTALCNIEYGHVIPGAANRLRQMTGRANLHRSHSISDPTDRPEKQNDLN